MANPYPWKEEKSHKPVKMFRHRARNISAIFAVVGSLVFSPVALLFLIWGAISYRRHNNAWQLRGSILMLVGLVLSFIFYGAVRLNPVEGFVGLMESFGNKGTDVSDAVVPYLLYGLPISLFFCGITLYFANGYLELHNRRYLRNSDPSIIEKIRLKKNSEKIAKDEMSANKLEVGVVADDILPWRQPRRGMIVGTDFSMVKHGMILGANGTGKTIAEMNMAAEYADAGWSIVIPDFKGDKKTENMAAAIARRNNVPFYSFWSNDTNTGLHYDPLVGVQNISPASIIITAFDFVVDGPAKFYTDQCEKYLALQFTALENGWVKREDSESMFDWLLRTSNPKTFAALLKPAAGQRDEVEREKVKRLIMEVNTVQEKNLSGLQANLSKVINTIGYKLRPSERMINFRKIADERAVVYFGLPSSGDKTVMRALGSLIIRDLVSYASERQGIENANVGTPMLIMPDEASQLGEKADSMLELLQQGRSARMFVFPAMQTFSSFSDRFIRELLGNSPTSIVFNVSDEVTAARLSDYFRKTYVRGERRDSKTETDFLGQESQQFSSGSSGNIDLGPRVSVNDIGELPARHALVHFPESRYQATIKKAKKDRVKKADPAIDIPVTLMVSRDYILEAEDDYDLPRQELQKTLGGAGVVVSAVEVDSLDLVEDVDDMDSVDAVTEDEVFDDAPVMQEPAPFPEAFDDMSDFVSQGQELEDEFGNPINPAEDMGDIVSGSVEDGSEPVSKWVPDESAPKSDSQSSQRSSGQDDKEEGHW